MSSSQSATQHQYPRPINPGGFSLPPLVEDNLPIVTTTTVSSLDDNGDKSNNDNDVLQTSILLIKPPDMESLWEWYAYTKRQTDSDPSWGRVWPTALSLSRFVIRSLNNNDIDGDEAVGEDSCSGGKDGASSSLMQNAMKALQTTSHVVEVGCGLGVAGLTYASTIISTTAATKIHSCVAMKETGVINGDNQQQSHKRRRTITFLDKEPYALHCVMASCATNGIVTGSIIVPPQSSEKTNSDVGITARAAIDDWTLPITTSSETTNTNSQIKNICYQDLHVPNKEDTIVLASDILYEPTTMKSLATKLQSLVNPINGGYVLIADPVKERTIGCRDSFVDSVKELNGDIDIVPLPELDGMRMSGSGVRGGMLLEGDMDIDGSLAKTVLIVVHFKGGE